MRRVAVLGLILTLGALIIVARDSTAIQNAATIEQVRDNLYVIRGGGGNTAAFLTQDGVVVVDTKLTDWGQAILDQIQTVTDLPVTMIVNTHTHSDHVGSNDEFPATVESIVAHENTKANMERMDMFAGDNARYLPSQTYSDRLSLLDGDDRLDLYYFGAGHTNGDTIIVFPALGTMHTGDLFPGPQVPYIDATNGGSGLAYPETLAAAAAGITGVQTVIPGHSDVTDWNAFVEFGEFNRDLLGAVEAAHTAGRSAAEAAGMLQLPARYDAYGRDRLEASVETIYEELDQR